MSIPLGYHFRLSVREGRFCATRLRRFGTSRALQEEAKKGPEPPKPYPNGTLADKLKAAYLTMNDRATSYYYEAKSTYLGSTKRSSIMEEEWYTTRVSFWMKRYENFVGLTDVKGAQARVFQTEKTFVQAQDDRRETQRLANEVQLKIKNLHTEIERTYRGEDRYLELVTMEHQLLKEEKALSDKLAVHEREEREGFTKLSRAVRDSHESERAQAEKTKYWSVIGSVVGTCIGIVGTTINNRLRMRELRQLVKDSAMGNSGAAALSAVGAEADRGEVRELSKKVEDMKERADMQLGEIARCVSGLREAVSDRGKSVRREEVWQLLEKQRQKSEEKMEELKKHLPRGKRAPELAAAASEIQAKVDQIVGEGGKMKVEASKAYETLNRNAATAMESFERRVFDIDEKLKDVRSLLLSQALSDDARIVTASYPSSQQQPSEAVERSHRTILGTVEVALNEHEQRLNSKIIVNSVIVAVLTPVVAYAISKAL